MVQPTTRARLFDIVWLALCLGLSSAWCLTAARQLSATFDEPLYLAKGLERWRTGSHSGLMRLGTMPLAIDWDTLPLHLYERWQGAPIDLVGNFDLALLVARAAGLVFWWLLLVYGWLAGRQLAGAWGGRLAVAWLACEPNLLAHATLATTDVAIAATLVALVYHFRAGRDRTWIARVGLPGLWLGAALLAKASGMVFGPLCLVVVELERLFRRHAEARASGANRCSSVITSPDFSRSRLQANAQPELDQELGNEPRAAMPDRFFLRACRGIRGVLDPQTVRQSKRDLMQIAALGFAVAFIYCGCDWRAEPSFVAWAQSLPAGAGRDVMLWISEHLCIFSNAGEGLVRQVKHNMRGHHGAYLLGQTFDRPVWYYFPLALTIKLSLPLLIAAATLMVKHPRRLLNWAGLAAMALLAFSLNCRVQIGIRLVLPLIVLLTVALAAALVVAARQTATVRRRLLAGGAVAAVAWTALASCRAWPEGLCYVNELWGGAADGYWCLSDSNYDWGQGVKELSHWRQERRLDRLDVWYFGTDPAANLPPLRMLPLHLLPLSRPEDVPLFAQPRYLAVGTTLLYGTPVSAPAHQRAVEFFRGRQPAARTATFLIYDLGERHAPAVAAAAAQVR